MRPVPFIQYRKLSAMHLQTCVVQNTAWCVSQYSSHIVIVGYAPSASYSVQYCVCNCGKAVPGFCVLRSEHICNVTAYRNAVTLQVNDTIQSYELNYHPMPHGVTVSCERYTLGFAVYYGSPSDVFAGSSGLVHL